MPTLYLLLRGLSSLRSAEQSTVLFNSPSHDPNVVTVDGRAIELNRMKLVIGDLQEEIGRRLEGLLFYEDEFSIPDIQDVFDEPRQTEPE